MRTISLLAATCLIALALAPLAPAGGVLSADQQGAAAPQTAPVDPRVAKL
jgi:hypothetical protein